MKRSLTERLTDWLAILASLTGLSGVGCAAIFVLTWPFWLACIGLAMLAHYFGWI